MKAAFCGVPEVSILADDDTELRTTVIRSLRNELAMSHIKDGAAVGFDVGSVGLDVLVENVGNDVGFPAKADGVGAFVRGPVGDSVVNGALVGTICAVGALVGKFAFGWTLGELDGDALGRGTGTKTGGGTGTETGAAGGK